MKGEEVIVEFREPRNETDDYGALLYDYTEESVSNVLVAPGPRSDIAESTRPDGRLVRYSLYFPKPFDRPLEGLRIKVRDRWTSVIGKPDHYTEGNSSGRWWLVVEVSDTDG